MKKDRGRELGSIGATGWRTGEIVQVVEGILTSRRAQWRLKVLQQPR